MKNRVLIAGGGTGGHVYPALAIAQALAEADPHLDIQFVGTKYGLEKTVIPKAGYKLHFVPSGMLNSNVSLFTRFKTILKLPFSFFKALYLLFILKPKAILGVGGYASAPILFVGGLFGYKTFIWEPNAMPGMANRKVSSLVDWGLIVYENARSLLRTGQFQKVGIPVRSVIEKIKNYELPEKSEKFHLFIVGGSQGAQKLNEVLMEILEKRSEVLKGIDVVHQIGRRNYKQYMEKLSHLKLDELNYTPLEFIDDMPEKYRWAHLIVCRGGASTLAEVCAVGRPSIIVPFPYAADNHQQKNAEQLQNNRAAKMILQKDLTSETLIRTIQELKDSDGLLKEYSTNVRAFHRPEAAKEIAQIILSNSI